MNLKKLKRKLFDLSYTHSLSHIGSCLTALPIIAEKYEKMSGDDKFVLSAGHAHVAHLIVMEEMGIIRSANQALLDYGIHCDRRAGCDASTGSLGHGISVALGMAVADRSRNVYCLCSDGELAEGSVWEAFRIQQEQKVDNLCVTVNVNGYSALGKIDTRKLMDRIYSNSSATIETSLPLDVDFPFLEGLQGHYHVMNEEEYKHALEVLA